MQRFNTIDEMRAQVKKWHDQGLSVGLVPTMGSLHAGHLSLVTALKNRADRIITSIFINPTQFGEGEDLDAYPSDVEGDMKLLDTVGVDAVYTPSVFEMYPDGFATKVVVQGLPDVLCGMSRPTHFDGVTQIVSKLLLQSGVDVAIFGEKDWQQLAIIRRMVKDLNIPIEIFGGPIIRDEKGLALSSRNRYLSNEQLEIARQFNVILKETISKTKAGAKIKDACDQAKAKLLNAGVDKVDYLEYRNAKTLELAKDGVLDDVRIFGAIHLGQARLLDNMAI